MNAVAMRSLAHKGVSYRDRRSAGRGSEATRVALPSCLTYLLRWLWNKIVTSDDPTLLLVSYRPETHAGLNDIHLSNLLSCLMRWLYYVGRVELKKNTIVTLFCDLNCAEQKRTDRKANSYDEYPHHRFSQLLLPIVTARALYSENKVLASIWYFVSFC